MRRLKLVLPLLLLAIAAPTLVEGRGSPHITQLVYFQLGDRVFLTSPARQREKLVIDEHFVIFLWPHRAELHQNGNLIDEGPILPVHSCGLAQFVQWMRGVLWEDAEARAQEERTNGCPVGFSSN